MSRASEGADASVQPFLGDSERGDDRDAGKYTFSPSKSPHYARAEPTPRGFRDVAAAALTRGRAPRTGNPESRLDGTVPRPRAPSVARVAREAGEAFARALMRDGPRPRGDSILRRLCV